MGPNFNELTPAQTERLSLLMEEMGESIQIIGKILRHGYESCNPITHGPTNRQLLERELGDVLAAMEFMDDESDFNIGVIRARMREKRESVMRWLHHQEPRQARPPLV